VRGVSGSGWVVPLERGDQGGHFGANFMKIGAVLRELCLVL
jgi:hypothetical protein